MVQWIKNSISCRQRIKSPTSSWWRCSKIKNGKL